MRRGDLDIHNDLGRMNFCDSRCCIPLGCILPRYITAMVQYQTDNIQHMTREERRAAMEILLLKGFQTEQEGITEHVHHETITALPTADDVSIDVPLCSICLTQYEHGDEVFASTTCIHRFHRDCIFDWLELRDNTECPFCRNPLVTNEDVWLAVQGLRREGQKEHRQQHNFMGYINRMCFSCCQSEISNTETSTDIRIGSGVLTEDGHGEDITYPPPFRDVEMGHSVVSILSREGQDATQYQQSSDVESGHFELSSLSLEGYDGSPSQDADNLLVRNSANHEHNNDLSHDEDSVDIEMGNSFLSIPSLAGSDVSGGLDFSHVPMEPPSVVSNSLKRDNVTQNQDFDNVAIGDCAPALPLNGNDTQHHIGAGDMPTQPNHCRNHHSSQ